ncbi:hypothetical protein BJX62DRAFT_233653 [Aspergillus germanicus]
MNRAELLEKSRPILDAIRDIIKSGNTEIGEKKPNTGWEYCGIEVSRQVSILEEILNKTEFEVVKTTVLHLIQGGTLHNPTDHLYLFPLQGTATLGPGDPLLPCHYVYKDTRVINGSDVDLIIVALRKK